MLAGDAVQGKPPAQCSLPNATKADCCGSTPTCPGALTANYTGNGVRTAARLAMPAGLVVVSSGSSYVLIFSEALSHRIRSYNASTGSVGLLVGLNRGNLDGEGTNARFTQPQGLAQPSGRVTELLVADRDNHKLRLVVTTARGGLYAATPANTNVSTLAGSGSPGSDDGEGASATFTSPMALAVSSDGKEVYVSEAVGVRRVVRSGMGLRTATVMQLLLTGYGTPVLAGVGGLLLYPGNTSLWIADTTNSALLSTDLSPPPDTAATLDFAVSAGTPLNGNQGVVQLSSDGALAIADSVSRRLLLLLPNGTVQLLAGSSSAAVGSSAQWGSAIAFGSLDAIAVVAGVPGGREVLVADTASNVLRSLQCVACPTNNNCASGTSVLNVGGFFYPSPWLQPQPCPAGTSSFANATALANCTQCGPGRWAGVGSAACSLCPPGTTSMEVNATSAAACKRCAPGLYAEKNLCRTCPANSFCANATAPLNCSAGSFSTAGAPAGCSPCPPGQYSPTPGQGCRACSANTYAASPGTVTCTSCASGSFSAPGSTACSDSCPNGFYLNATALVQLLAAGNSSSSQELALPCLPCPAGTERGGDSSSTTVLAPGSDTPFCRPCGLGYYSKQGAAACSYASECSPGYYCAGGLQNPCPAGTVNSVGGGTDPSVCIPCAPGYSSSVEGASQPCTACQAGSHGNSAHPEGLGSTQCSPCPMGTASPVTAAVNSSQCAPCEASSFSSLLGQAFCVSYCPQGYFGASTGGSSLASACVECPRGSFSAFSGSTDCAQCPPGAFAASSASSQCQGCAPGSIGELVGATSQDNCTQCQSGSYSSAAGSTSCTAW